LQGETYASAKVIFKTFFNVRGRGLIKDRSREEVVSFRLRRKIAERAFGINNFYADVIHPFCNKIYAVSPPFQIKVAAARRDSV
jgi:hypothetical protein